MQPRSSPSPGSGGAHPRRPPPPPGFIAPQRLQLVDQPHAGPGWVHEIKYDVYRMQLHVAGGRARWWSRNGLDWSDRLAALGRLLGAELPDCVLDGELCAMGRDGLPDFSALRALLKGGAGGEADRSDRLVFHAFDLLWLEGEDLRPVSLYDRKARLAEVAEAVETPALRLVEPMPEASGPALLKAACGLGLEGVVSKRLDAPYQSGARLETWRKAKCRASQELVIGGWKAEGPRLRSILTGVWEADRLRYTGIVGTGFSVRVAAELLPRLRAAEAARSPFRAGEPPRKADGLHWARPELVAEVEIAEWTEAGVVRQASYKGLREDKAASAVRRE